MANKTINAVKSATTKNTIKVRATVDTVARKTIRLAALVILSYLAWKGVSDLVATAHVARLFVSYVSVIGLLALYILI